MRDPYRWRNIALEFCASGWVTCAAAFLLPGPAANDAVRGLLFIYGVSAIIFGGGTALFRHLDLRAKQALARGENIIARWRVAPAAWGEFVESERQPGFWHGTGEGGNPEDLSRCYNCGYEIYKLISHCPECGRGLQSKRWSRRYGAILFVFGLFISSVMGFVLLLTLPTLLQRGTSRFVGSAAQAMMVLGIIGAVETFGVTIMCYGLAGRNQAPQQAGHLFRDQYWRTLVPICLLRVTGAEGEK